MNNFSLLFCRIRKLDLMIFYAFILFSAENTIGHDLDNLFTKNVKVVTKYVSVVTGVIVVTLQ